jgi:hypothetical protein
MKKVSNITPWDIIWHTRNIYFEARGESRTGRLAVAMVALNRVTWEKRYPNNISDVVTQPKQFSWYNTGTVPPITEPEIFLQCKELALVSVDLYNYFTESGLHEVDPIVQGAQYYFGDYIKPPKWAEKMTFITKIEKTFVCIILIFSIIYIYKDL